MDNTGYRGEAIDKLASEEWDLNQAKSAFQNYLNTEYKNKSWLEKMSYNADYPLKLANRGGILNKTLLSSALASIEIISVFIESDNLNRLKKIIVSAMEEYNINNYYAVYMISVIILLTILIYLIAKFIFKIISKISKKFKKLDGIDMEINVSFKNKE